MPAVLPQPPATDDHDQLRAMARRNGIALLEPSRLSDDNAVGALLAQLLERSIDCRQALDLLQQARLSDDPVPLTRGLTGCCHTRINPCRRADEVGLLALYPACEPGHVVYLKYCKLDGAPLTFIGYGSEPESVLLMD